MWTLALGTSLLFLAAIAGANGPHFNVYPLLVNLTEIPPRGEWTGAITGAQDLEVDLVVTAVRSQGDSYGLVDVYLLSQSDYETYRSGGPLNPLPNGSLPGVNLRRYPRQIAYTRLPAQGTYIILARNPENDTAQTLIQAVSPIYTPTPSPPPRPTPRQTPGPTIPLTLLAITAAVLLALAFALRRK